MSYGSYQNHEPRSASPSQQSQSYTSHNQTYTPRLQHKPASPSPSPFSVHTHQHQSHSYQNQPSSPSLYPSSAPAYTLNAAHQLTPGLFPLQMHHNTTIPTHAQIPYNPTQTHTQATAQTRISSRNSSPVPRAANATWRGPRDGTLGAVIGEEEALSSLLSLFYLRYSPAEIGKVPSIVQVRKLIDSIILWPRPGPASALLLARQPQTHSRLQNNTHKYICARTHVPTHFDYCFALPRSSIF